MSTRDDDGSSPSSAHEQRRFVGRLFSWSLIGRSGAALFAWSVLILISKVGDAELARLRMGEYVFALALTSPLVPIARMELRGLLASDGRWSAPLPLYVRLRSYGGVLLVAVGAVVAALLWRDGTVALTVLALSALRAVEGGLDLVHGLYERSDRHDLVARSELLRAGAGMVTLGVALVLTDSLPVAMAFVVVVWAGVLAGLDLPTARAITREGPVPRPSAPGVDPPTTTWGLAWMAAPLGVAAFLTSLNTTLPRYFVEDAAGKEGLAVFGGIAYLMAALSLVYQAVLVTFLPRFGRHLAHGRPDHARREMLPVMALTLVPGLLIAMVGFWWGDELLVLLYREGFEGHAVLIVWITAANVLGSAAGVPRALLTAAGRLRAQPVILAITFAVNLVLCILLVPGAPLIGAAQALLFSRGLQTALNLVVALRVLRRWPRSPEPEAA